MCRSQLLLRKTSKVFAPCLTELFSTVLWYWPCLVGHNLCLRGFCCKLWVGKTAAMRSFRIRSTRVSCLITDFWIQIITTFINFLKLLQNQKPIDKFFLVSLGCRALFVAVKNGPSLPYNMRRNLLNGCNWVSISKKLMYYVGITFGLVRIY